MTVKKRAKGEEGGLSASPHRWRQVFEQTARDLLAGSVLEWAASLAFYAVLSMFPLLIALLVLASYIVDAEWAARAAVETIGNYLPSGEYEVQNIIDQALAQRGRLGVISFVAVLVTGRRVLGVLTKGLNHVSDVDEQSDPYVRQALAEVAMVVGLVGLGVLLLGGRPLIGDVLGWAGTLDGPGRILWQVVEGAVRLSLLLGVFLLLYYYVPRGERYWRAALTGAIVAMGLYVAAEAVYSLFIDRIRETLSLIYGPMAMAVLLLTWTWYVALLTLIGASVASHVKVLMIEKHDVAQARMVHTGR